MKNHDNALWLLLGIRPIEVNEVAIASSIRSRLSGMLGPGRMVGRIVCTCGFFAHLGSG